MSTDQSMVSYRELEEFPGYRFGDDGSVWTCREKVGRRGRGTMSVLTDTWRPHKCHVNRFGYVCVKLLSRPYKVHRLILAAFVGPCPVGRVGCHNDGNPSNNALPNLRWGTPQDNADDRRRHGRTRFGEDRASSKLTEDIVRAMRQEYDAVAASGRRVYGVITKLAVQYKVSTHTAGQVCHRYSWTHVT